MRSIRHGKGLFFCHSNRSNQKIWLTGKHLETKQKRKTKRTLKRLPFLRRKLRLRQVRFTVYRLKPAIVSLRKLSFSQYIR